MVRGTETLRELAAEWALAAASSITLSPAPHAHRLPHGVSPSWWLHVFLFAPTTLPLQHLFPFIAQSIRQVFILLLFPLRVNETSYGENDLNLL